MEILFDNITHFYSRDCRRRLSVESDFGVQWIGMNRWPAYRVSFIHDTGEVYAVQEKLGGSVILIAVGLPEGDDGYSLLVKLLSGWEDVCGKPFSLGWVSDALWQYVPDVIRD